MFINNLENILLQKNISTYRMCQDTSIATSSVSGWKQGKMPSIEKLIIIAQYLEVSSDELLGINTKNDFTTEEQQIIKAYRTVSPEIKNVIKATLEVSKPKQSELDELCISKTG